MSAVLFALLFVIVDGVVGTDVAPVGVVGGMFRPPAFTHEVTCVRLLVLLDALKKLCKASFDCFDEEPKSDIRLEN
jgi:hypothetical protein